MREWSRTFVQMVTYICVDGRHQQHAFAATKLRKHKDFCKHSTTHFIRDAGYWHRLFHVLTSQKKQRNLPMSKLMIFYRVAYQMQNKRFVRHRNFAVETVWSVAVDERNKSTDDTERTDDSRVTLAIVPWKRTVFSVQSVDKIINSNNNHI